ncbi:MAG: hypothetical protein KIG82_04100 [Prevotella sp.]|nr:hypothetical protein [Prevotella sp.]
MKTILTIIASLFALSLPSAAQSEDIITIIPRDDSLAVQNNAGESNAVLLQQHATKTMAKELHTTTTDNLTTAYEPLTSAIESAAKTMALPALTDLGKMDSLSHT